MTLFSIQTQTLFHLCFCDTVLLEKKMILDEKRDTKKIQKMLFDQKGVRNITQLYRRAETKILL